MKLEFPGGDATVSDARTERKLADLLDLGYHARVTHKAGAWRVQLVGRFDTYTANSEQSLTDAFSHALQLAVGREENLEVET